MKTPVPDAAIEALEVAAEALADVQPKRLPGYPAYQPSDVSWLGDIPRGWSVKRLRFVSRVNPVKSELKSVGPDDAVSFVPMEALHEYGGMSLEQERLRGSVEQGYTYFRDGDIVIAKITPCFENGKGSIAAGLTNGVGFGTTELHVVRPQAELDRDFAFYLTMCDPFRKLGEGEMFGAGGQKRVPDSFIKDFRAPLPPRTEQRTIALFLQRETAKIDGLVEKKRRLINLLNEKRTALISHAVTKGLDPNAPMKPSGIAWLGNVPKHWEFRKLGFMVRMRGGATPSKSNDAYWKGNIPWVSPKDMKVREITDSEDHLSELALEESSLQLIDPPVVLMVVRGMILAHTFPVAITRAPVTINQDMKALTPDADCTPEYLLNLLNGMSLAILGIVEGSAHGTRVLRMPLWKHVGVYTPDIDEQASICSYIDRESQRFDTLIEKVQLAVDALHEHRSALISAAVTGKIDVRGEVTA